jgi:hypothetical protein
MPSQHLQSEHHRSGSELLLNFNEQTLDRKPVVNEQRKLTTDDADNADERTKSFLPSARRQAHKIATREISKA